MIDYQTFCQIRHLRDEAHLNITQIARQLGLHRQTVSQWARRPRYECRQSAPARRRASKLDAFKPAIQRLLATHAYSATQLYQRPRRTDPLTPV
jgi:IS30 family transposase